MLALRIYYGDGMTFDDTQGSPDAEPHVALIEWTLEAGAKAGKHEIHLLVANLEQVP